MNTEDIIIMSFWLAVLAFGVGTFLYCLIYWLITGTNPGVMTSSTTTPAGIKSLPSVPQEAKRAGEEHRRDGKSHGKRMANAMATRWQSHAPYPYPNQEVIDPPTPTRSRSSSPTDYSRNSD